MAKKQICVGAEYAKAFESICELINGGCLSELGFKVKDGYIDDGINEYRLAKTESGFVGAEEQGFTESGASWFSTLRGDKTEKDSAVWTSFMETVKEEYHKRFSVVEYKQQPPSKAETERARKEITEFVNRFVKTFYPVLTTNLDIRMQENGEEDVYGVSLRLELSGGTGASLPVLGKVYFLNDGKRLVPIEKKLAKIYDDSVNKIIPEDSDGEELTVADRIIDDTLNAVEKLVENGNSDFAEYLCFGDESDAAAVKKLFSQLSHDANTLECTRLDILYITHVKVGNFIASVVRGGDPVFNVKTGAGNGFTVTCAKCNAETPLVYDNQIVCIADGKQKIVTLDVKKEDFGLDEVAVAQIIAESELKNHYLKVCCQKIKGWQNCEAVRCLSQLFDADSSSAVVYKCSDCPYPEIVYTTENGVKKYTPAMVFVKDRMELVDVKDENEEKVERCKVCGRYFSSRVVKHGKCPVCKASETATESSEYRAAYGRYKTLLSFGRRAKAHFTKKACVEDNEIIIFVIGKHRYLFNKLNVKERGFIAPPIKID